MKLTNTDKSTWIETLWMALEDYRENCISTDDSQWDEICTAMAWISDELMEDEE